MGFIEQIAPLIQKNAPQYGINCISAPLAQAILESGSGTSELAINARNYFGLKYNPSQPNRCPSHNGYYVKKGSEQNPDGSYVSSVMYWQKFDTMEKSVKGYFDFLNYSRNYDCLKGISDPRTYLTLIKTAGYATSINYVDKLMNVIQKYNLTQYDKKEETKMGYTNSSLVTYQRITPNTYGKRTHAIDRISIHVFVGQVSVTSGVNTFSSPGYKWSCNYVCAKDGQIGLVLPESHASICTSNKANDERAITIETASDTFAPYKITDAAAKGLINLCVDICKRNGKNTVIWIPDKSKTEAYKPKANEMIFSVHRWYAKKSCCGDYIFNQLSAIASKCTKILGGQEVAPVITPTPPIPKPQPTPVVPKTDIYDWKNNTYNGIRLDYIYNGKFYYEHNLDLKALVDKMYKKDEDKAKALFEHFCTKGINEPRQAIATFNPVVYRKNNLDVEAFYGDKWAKYYSHYILCGHKENRKAY